jgi:hypothetical protein
MEATAQMIQELEGLSTPVPTTIESLEDELLTDLIDC